jgi:hypothetical protein
MEDEARLEVIIKQSFEGAFCLREVVRERLRRKVEVPFGKSSLVGPRKRIRENRDPTLFVDECVLMVAMTWHVDRFEGANRVTVAIAVVGSEFGLKVGAFGYVGLDPELPDDGVESADVVAIGVGDDETFDVNTALGDTLQ